MGLCVPQTINEKDVESWKVDRLRKQRKDKERLVGVYKEVTPDSVLFSAFPSAHCGCSLNLCGSLTRTVRLNDLWVLRSHA